MSWLWCAKDGGPESKVYAWGLEIKWLFSILLLKFEHGSREAYHSHAFNSISWLLNGGLVEYEKFKDGAFDVIHARQYFPSFLPILTRRSTFHKVNGVADANWVFTIRGPWSRYWHEFDPKSSKYTTLTHGRETLPLPTDWPL